MSEQDFITKRQAEIAKAWNSQSIEDLISFYADDNLDFTDWAVGALHMDKASVRSFFINIFNATKNLKIETFSLNGTKSFTTWEWNLSFEFHSVMEETVGMEEFSAEKADGRLVRMVGVSVSWWNEEGKIIRNNDYGKVVESFDGRK